jgi:hypothetical protein
MSFTLPTPEELDLNQAADLELTDPIEIQRLLAVMPKIILKCEEKVQEAEIALEWADDALDVQKATKELIASNDPMLSAAQDRKAWARVQPEVVAAHEDVITKKGHLKQAQLLMKKYERYDTNVRKAANIFEVLQNAEMAQLKYMGRAGS